MSTPVSEGGPDLLERTRMALAEVGVTHRSAAVRRGGFIQSRARWVDNRTAWRAVSLAKMHKDRSLITMCFQCTLANHPDAGNKAKSAAAAARCQASLPLTEDCGISRGDS